jgi:hypothetical protein
MGLTRAKYRVQNHLLPCPSLCARLRPANSLTAMASHKPHLLSATNFVANSQRLHHSWPGIVVLARNCCIRKNCLLVEFAGSRWRPGVKWSRSMASGSIFHRLFGSGWRQSAPEDELLSWTFLPFSSFASSRLLIIPIGNRENWPAYISRMENTDSPLHSVTNDPYRS